MPAGPLARPGRQRTLAVTWTPAPRPGDVRPGGRPPGRWSPTTAPRRSSRRCGPRASTSPSTATCPPSPRRAAGSSSRSPRPPPTPRRRRGRSSARTRDVLALAQEFLAAARLADAHLTVVTTRAVGTGPGEDVTDLDQAAVWGLLRTAQSENPGRIILLDTDEQDSSPWRWPGPPSSASPSSPSGTAPCSCRGSSRGATDGALTPPPGEEHWRLGLTISGELDSLSLDPSAQTALSEPARCGSRSARPA